jgi:hypothetical protein
MLCIATRRYGCVPNIRVSSDSKISRRVCFNVGTLQKGDQLEEILFFFTQNRSCIMSACFFANFASILRRH